MQAGSRRTIRNWLTRSCHFEKALLSKQNVREITERKIETMVAFANTEGGLLLLGVEDEDRAEGRDRLYGIQENEESVDELRRLILHRITPPIGEPASEPPRFIEIGCTLRDGSEGSIIAVQVPKSTSVHSVVDGGTFVRYNRSTVKSQRQRLLHYPCAGARQAL